MPVYEYKCPSCDISFVLNRSMEERDVEALCSSCGSVSVRIFSSVNAIFKGGGFYSTDKND